jgi:uncharacterized Rmd1/YagE family protein
MRSGILVIKRVLIKKRRSRNTTHLLVHLLIHWYIIIENEKCFNLALIMARIIAYGLSDTLDIKGIKATLQQELKYNDSDELFYATPEGCFVCFYKYGVACFFNYNEEQLKTMLELLRPFCKNPYDHLLNEEYEVDQGPLEVGYTKMKVPSFHPDLIRIIMFNVSQSVAMDYCSELTDSLMEETNYHTQMLEKKGRLGIRGRALMRYIGRTLYLKNRIAENLYIFDSPPQTWENEELDKLHRQLKRLFDLQDRFRDVSEGIGIVKENLELFKDLLQHRNSTMLEWIVIGLIAIEVFHFLWNEVFR